MGGAVAAQDHRAVTQRRDAKGTSFPASSSLPGNAQLQTLQRLADAAPGIDRTLALGDALNPAQAMPPSRAGAPPVVQRNIGASNPAPTPFFRGLNLANQAIRAPWVGPWAAAAVGPGLSRNHVIPYHHIAEALTNLLNLIYTQRAAAPGVMPAAVGQLTAMAASLFPNPAVPGHAAMQANLTAAVLAIFAAVPAPTAARRATMANRATALESDLTSAQDNVRLGNANMNLRLGNNIDANFVPGLIALPAYAMPTPAFLPAGFLVPAAWTAMGGANWGLTRNAGVIPVGARFYCMTTAHNNLTWSFGAAAAAHIQTNLTVVRNDDPFNPVPGYTANAPLSSTGNPGAGLAPAAANSAVVLFDPAGLVPPYRFI